MWTFVRFAWFIVIFSTIFGNSMCDSSTSSSNCEPLQPPMDNLTQEAFLSKLTAPCRYDRLIKSPADDPLTVSFQLDVKHIENIDNKQFKSHLLIQIHFRDSRLNFSSLSPARTDILGEESLRNRIFIPHLIIKNERSSSFMGLDQKDMFVKIQPSGEVTYSFRMTVTFYCEMNLRKFPFDHQSCQLIWTSWAYNESNLHLQWVQDQPYVLADNLKLTEFSLDDIWIENTTYSNYISNNWGDGYSSLVFNFKLKREVGYYIMDYFLPSVLLVITSWITFWIQADASPARTTLGTATMLSFITLNGNVTKNLPKVNYITASEIWFFGGATFIFCSLAEFAFVNVVFRRKKKVELAKQSPKYIIKGALSPRLARKEVHKLDSLSGSESNLSDSLRKQNDGSSNLLYVPTISVPNNIQDVESAPPTRASSQQWAEMNPKDVANWIDRKARIIFPVAFIIYNLLYWGFVYAL